MQFIIMNRYGLNNFALMNGNHQSKVIEPISIHYNKLHNLVLVHAINIGKDLGWKLAEIVTELAELRQGREIVSLEGVGSPDGDDSRVFYYSTSNGVIAKKLQGIANPLNEGIIVGVTGALLAKQVRTPLVALFAEAKVGLPDSKAAAHIIQALDAYVGLGIDVKPLLKQAVLFEKKLRGIVQKGQRAEQIREDKHLSYVG